MKITKKQVKMFLELSRMTYNDFANDFEMSASTLSWRLNKGSKYLVDRTITDEYLEKKAAEKGFVFIRDGVESIEPIDEFHIIRAAWKCCKIRQEELSYSSGYSDSTVRSFLAGHINPDKLPYKTIKQAILNYTKDHGYEITDRGIFLSKITKAANGQHCTLRSPVCNGNRETVVLCHLRSAVNAGASYKPNDMSAIFACSACHGYMGDNPLNRRFSLKFEEYFDLVESSLRAMLETHEMLRKKGVA